MPGEVNAVFFAPFSAAVDKRLGEELTYEVMIAPAYDGGLAAGQLKKGLRQMRRQIKSAFFAVIFIEIGRPWEGYILLLLREIEGIFSVKIRLVSENCRNLLAEIIADALFVGFVSDFEKIVRCARAENIDVGLTVAPAGGLLSADIDVELSAGGGVIFTDFRICIETAVGILRYIVCGEKIRRTDGNGVIFRKSAVYRICGKKQVFC